MRSWAQNVPVLEEFVTGKRCVYVCVCVCVCVCVREREASVCAYTWYGVCE